jgi:DNA-directed RNA polymerase
MNPTKQKLVDSIIKRIEVELSSQNPVKFLKELDPVILADTTVSVTYLYTRLTRGNNRKQVTLAEVISAIGHGIRNKYKMKRDSAKAAKAGGFLLFSLQTLGIINVKLGKGDNNHQTYIVEVLEDDLLSEMWNTLTINKTEKLPSEVPYADWQISRHETGAFLVKTSNKDVLDALTAETHPIVFDTINKAQHVGWKINEDIYELQQWALRNKTDAFSDIWDQHNPEAMLSKLREAKAIGSIAQRFLGKEFFHLYYLDFRGRKYPATAYLHEQGSDLSKGLLVKSEGKPITEQGFFWLMIVIANSWAGDAGREDGYKTDKIPLNDRVYWALDNEEILLSYVENPKVNQGWMKADKPWQFMAACFELKKLRDFQKARLVEIEAGNMEESEITEYDYNTNFIGFIDGSNNGSQHLSALTKDEVTAPHVNLVQLDLPGDLYKYVGDHVWDMLVDLESTYSKEDIAACEIAIDNLTELKKQIHEAELRSDKRKELIEAIRKFRTDNAEILDMAAVVYWLRITDSKHKRKIVKRNVMTLPYGGSAYGLGQQQIDDARKHGIEQLITLEHKWASFMGHAVYDDAKVSLKRPMRLLSIFERAGKKAEETQSFLKWTVPLTNFPVVQNYTQGRVKKIYVQYGPPQGERISSGYYENTYQMAICFLEEPTYSKKRQAQGASPNAIHSLDAAHLMLTVSQAPFDVVTVHDSFGALLPDLPDLFILIRETFVQLYEADPLTSLMKDIDGDISGVEIGTLDIKSILDSEYAFA